MTATEKLRAAAGAATSLLKALANQDRLMLLCQLAEGPHCVSELEEKTGVRQPTLSQQLTVLRNEDLVSTRREGKQIYYSVASPAALAVLQTLYDHFCAKEKA